MEWKSNAYIQRERIRWAIKPIRNQTLNKIPLLGDILL